MGQTEAEKVWDKTWSNRECSVKVHNSKWDLMDRNGAEGDTTHRTTMITWKGRQLKRQGNTLHYEMLSNS